MPTLKENCKLHYIISLFCVTGCLSRSYKHRPYPKKKALLSTKTIVGETFSKICHCSDPNMNIHEVVIGKLP